MYVIFFQKFRVSVGMDNMAALRVLRVARRPSQCWLSQTIWITRRVYWAYIRRHSPHLNNTISVSGMALLNSRTIVMLMMPCTSWTGRSCVESGWSSNMPVVRAETETSTVGVTGVVGAVSTVITKLFLLFLSWWGVDVDHIVMWL